MDRARHRNGALTQRIIEHRLWGDSPFFLLDVGCSGGIEQHWNVFGQHLRAIGFDPLVAEINRLAAETTSPGVSYEAAFVGCREYGALFPPALRLDRITSRNDDPFPRVSAMAAQSRFELSYTQEVFNAGAPVVMADRTVVLDDRIADHEHTSVDFLKVDTDGHDIEVVLGAERIMASGGLLGLKVEVQLHGAIHPYANTFANIDRVIRAHGFTLFDLTTYQYSRRELPAPFVFDLAAQTTSGQVVWGDALYMRDLGSPDYERMWSYAITPERVMKLACLFDIFELPDCAAELLVNRGDFLEPGLRSALLDDLAGAGPGSYVARIAAFEADPRALYPSRLRLTPEGAAGQPGDGRDESSARRSQRLQERVKELREKNGSLRDRLKARGDRIEQLTRRIEQLEQKS